MPKELLNARDAANYLGCGVSTLWRWAANGTIPKPIKIGGISRWRYADLNRLIENAPTDESE